MKKLLFSGLLLALFSAIPAAAQPFTVGMSFGGAESMDDGFKVHFNQPVKEVFFQVGLEPDSAFKVKAGQMDSEAGSRLGEGVPDKGKIDYVDGVVEYSFDEIFGSAGVFGGPGFYRQRFGTFEDSNWGLTFGGNAVFPITRRTGFLAELAYHHIASHPKMTALVASAGLRFSF